MSSFGAVLSRADSKIYLAYVIPYNVTSNFHFFFPSKKGGFGMRENCYFVLVLCKCLHIMEQDSCYRLTSLSLSLSLSDSLSLSLFLFLSLTNQSVCLWLYLSIPFLFYFFLFLSPALFLLTPNKKLKLLRQKNHLSNIHIVLTICQLLSPQAML